MTTEECVREFEIESRDGEKLAISEIAIIADISDFSGTKHRKTGERFETKDGKKVNRNDDGGFEVVSTGKVYYEKAVQV